MVDNEHEHTAPGAGETSFKNCAHCGQSRPITEFLRRTGRRTGSGARRGACKACRKLRASSINPDPKHEPIAERQESIQLRGALRRKPERAAAPDNNAEDAKDNRLLRPNRKGLIWMRGRTDKGRRWHQEIEPDLAYLLVREHAAVVLNRHTIRRLYSNKDFRRYILTRDNYTCFFCGGYGDTIDHMVPRAKGGHTTPVNCVCACNSCNQSKADQDLDEFMKG